MRFKVVLSKPQNRSQRNPCYQSIICSFKGNSGSGKKRKNSREFKKQDKGYVFFLPP